MPVCGCGWQGLVRGRVHPPLVLTIIAIFQPALSSKGPEQAAQLSLIMVTDDTPTPASGVIRPYVLFSSGEECCKVWGQRSEP